MIQGSSKRKISLVFPFIIASAFYKDKAVNISGSQVIIYMIAFIILIAIVEYIFDRKEIISHDWKVLNLDLARCLIVINISDIKSMHLKETVNDLIVETNESTHTYKLYGFRREKIQKFIASINDYSSD